jgi:RNA polymerase sigma-70 factor (ECF subfamily)
VLKDEELVKEIQGGNEAAMELLVKRHYNMIFSYIARKLGDRHKAADLTQETFIKMMKNITSLELQEGKFVNWLLKIAVNTCRDYFKSSQYKVSSKEYELVQDITYSPNIVYMLERKEDIKRIKIALAELPSFQSEAIILKFYHQKKYGEIAEITGCNESTAKSRVKQGLVKLKGILERGEEYEAARYKEASKV